MKKDAAAIPITRSKSVLLRPLILPAAPPLYLGGGSGPILGQLWFQALHRSPKSVLGNEHLLYIFRYHGIVCSASLVVQLIMWG